MGVGSSQCVAFVVQSLPVRLVPASPGARRSHRSLATK